MTGKMKFETSNLTAMNLAKLAELFPGVVVEGKVNVDLLRSYIGEEVFADEAYEFTWVGKRAAIAEAGRPIRKTLRPCIEESKDWETTENLYIEGDNLDVLKLLQESYLGKVKMIYIDPPYNTGNDFVYRDNFAASREDYEEETGVYDEDGDRLLKNIETHGRFHSDWCSMIYPRLVLARNLLRDDGVVFISIDDSEVAQLRKICDEVLGESNFVACIVWERAYSPVNLKKHFSESHDYVICYANDINNLLCNGLSRSEDADNRYSNPDNDQRGVWKSSDLSVGPAIANNIYEIITPSGKKVMPPSGYSWRLSKGRFNEFVADNRIWFGNKGENVPSIKRFLSEVKQGITPMTIWKYQEVGHSQKASQDLKRLFDDKSVFTYPKPVELVKRLLELYTNSNSIILDFFSGSATTAHAVMQLNAEDGGRRKFIMVQLQEPCDEKSEAFKAGYKNICEIGKERIRRAGDKIAGRGKRSADNKENADRSALTTNHSTLLTNHSTLPTNHIDIGFRVLKLDDTNMNEVYYAAGDYTQDMLKMMESNIKPDRTDLDLLFGCLLDWGLQLSLPHQREWLVDSEKWLEIEKELMRNGCKKLHGVVGLAESDGINGRSIPNRKEASERGIIRIVGSNASGCCIDPVKYSGRTSENLHQGVFKFSLDSQGVESGIRNATRSLCESGVPCKFGYCNSDATGARSGQNVKCPHENTQHCPLTANRSSLTTLHTYNDGDLIACFEERVSEKVVREIASRNPLRVVFRDSSFTSSPEKINVFEIFKLLSSNTNVRVI